MKKLLTLGVLLLALLLAVSFAAVAADTTLSASDRAAIEYVIKAVQNTRAAKNDVTMQLTQAGQIYKVTDSLGLLQQKEVDAIIKDSVFSDEKKYTFSNGVGNVDNGSTETLETSLPMFFVPEDENKVFYNLLSVDYEKYISDIKRIDSDIDTQISFTLSNVKFVLLDGKSLIMFDAFDLRNVSVTYNNVEITASIDSYHRIRTVQVKTDYFIQIVESTDAGDALVRFYYSFDETVQFAYSNDETGDPDEPNIRTGDCGDTATYELDVTTGALTISGTGKIYDNAFTGNQLIRSVVIDDGITGIGSGAFKDCSGIRSAAIPESVASFGENIFSGCSNLEILIAPFWGKTSYYDTVQAFPLGYYFGTQSFSGAEQVQQYYYSNYYGYVNFYIPTALHTVNVIGTPQLEGTFRSCQYIRNVVISDQTNVIGDYAFSGCVSLQKLTISDSVTSIGYEAFYKCFALKELTLSDSLERINKRAFSNCSALEELTIPDSVTNIGYEAFAFCTSLKNLTLPRNLTDCGDNILRGCRSLETLTCAFYTRVDRNSKYTYEYHYPLGYFFGGSGGSGFYGVKQRYKYVTYRVASNGSNQGPIAPTVPTEPTRPMDPTDPTNTTDPTTPATPTEPISYEYYNDWYNTYYAYIPETLKTVNVYGECPAGAFMNCTQLEAVNFLDPISEIGAYAFAYCANIKSFAIPSTVTSIGDYAFVKCAALEAVDFPPQLRAIGRNAYYGCEKLTTLSIPGSVETIGSYAFAQCKGLVSLTLNEGVRIIRDHAFYHCEALPALTVPSSVVEIGTGAFAYETALKKVDLLAVDLQYLDQYVFRGSFAIEEMTAPFYWQLGYFFGGRTKSDYNGFSGVSLIDQGYNRYYWWASALYYIPDSLTTVHAIGHSVASNAFMNCGNVKTITLPDGLVRIPYRAFYGNTGITAIVIPKSVKVIEEQAFCNCANLQTVGFAQDAAAGVADATTQNSKLTQIGPAAFRNCDALTEVTVPYYTATIDAKAFYDCDALQRVVFAESSGDTNAEMPRTKLKTIGNAAFGRCEQLGNLRLPYRVASIGYKAFIGDLGLTQITVPRYVESIGAYAYYGCRNVSEISYRAKAATVAEKQGYYDWKTGTNIPAKYHPFYQTGADTDGLTVTLEDTVRKVPARLFYKNSALKKLVISAKVTEIGDYAFYRCGGMSKIVYQTKTDEATTQPVAIALTHIGRRAFSRCESLRTLNIPSSVKTMGAYAFSDCTKVGTLYYRAKNMNRDEPCSHVFDGVGENANGLTAVICNTVRTVPAKLLYKNQALFRLSVSQRVTAIGYAAFDGCKALNEVTFAAAIRKTLTDLSFTRLGEIGSRAFARCGALERIDIPETVSYIGEAAFAGCRALRQVHFGTKDTATGTDVSRSALREISAGTFRKCSALPSIIIPDTVEAIGFGAFDRCTHLKNVYFGSIAETAQHAQLQTIADCAFRDCKRMNWFKFPQTVSLIGYSAFENCRSLKKLTLPESVATIQSSAFDGCSRLRSIKILNAACVVDYYSTTFPESATLYAYSNHSSAKAYSILFVRTFRILHGEQHKTRTEAELPAKCTEEGYTAGIYCEDCEAWIDGHDTIPAHGHRYVVASQIPATDTQEAALLYVCTYDHSHLLYEPIGSDHKPGKAVIENEVPATCTKPGSYDSVIYCTDCGKELSRSSVATAKAPHTPGTEERKNEVAPTCQKDGKVTLITYCAVCGGVMKTEQLVLPKSGHTPSTPVREKEVPATASTYGSYEEVTYCSVCGIEMSREVKSIAPLNHEHQYVPTETVPATCTKEGRQTLTCSICGDAKTETLPKADHVDTDNDGYCDTCEQLMTGGDHCKYCGQIHGGAFGWLTRFFHSILALFGARK